MLHVRLIEGRGLPGLDANNKSDPYGYVACFCLMSLSIFVIRCHYVGSVTVCRCIRSIFKLKSASSKLFSGKGDVAKHLHLKSAYKTKVCMGTVDPVWIEVRVQYFFFGVWPACNSCRGVSIAVCHRRVLCCPHRTSAFLSGTFPNRWW